MNIRDFAEGTAGQLRAHQKSLAGRAEDVETARIALQASAEAITTHAGSHAADAYSATENWNGRSADGFDRRAGRVGKNLALTADAAAKGAAIIATTHNELAARRQAVSRLLDEYVNKATAIFEKGNQAGLAGTRNAINGALGEVLTMRASFTAESAKHLAAVQTAMKDAAGKLRALEREIEHDGFADRRRTPAGSAKSVTRPSNATERRKPTRPAPRAAAPAVTPPRTATPPRVAVPPRATPPRQSPARDRQEPRRDRQESKTDAQQEYDLPRNPPFGDPFQRGPLFRPVGE